MTDLPSEITEFVRNVMGRPTKQDELVNEIIVMASHNPAWPTATHEQWDAAIDKAVEQKLLTRVSKTIWLVCAIEEAKPKQMGLFE